jgi:predicted dehydrogenase
MSEQLRVGMVGYAFMGAAHSQAWRTVNHFFDLPLAARMSLVCGRSPDGGRGRGRKLGWESHTTDWRALVERDDIDLVDICTPGDTHAEIALGRARRRKARAVRETPGQHVAEAREMAAAAAEANPRAYGQCAVSTIGGCRRSN